MLLAVVLCALVTLTQGEVNQLIVGGEDGTYGDHPSICSLQAPVGSFYRHLCGCVIWNANYVVTAAHCLTLPASSYRVIVGLHRLYNIDSHRAGHFVNSYTLHPEYNVSAAGFPNDIAVMNMTVPISFNSYVAKANFAQNGSFEGQSCRLAGWGRLSDGGTISNTLQKVNMTTISNSECQSKWSGVIGASVNAGHICFFSSGKSACGGDSGGPVHCGDKMTGIGSWGINVCSDDYPNVYTRVSHFYDWLTSQAGDN